MEEVDLRLQHDGLADVHRRQEVEAVDRCGDDRAARVPHAGDAGAHVDPLHHDAAEQHARDAVGVHRHHDLRHHAASL